MADVELHRSDGDHSRIRGPGRMGLGTTACERPLCTTHGGNRGVNPSRFPQSVDHAELLPLRRCTFALRLYADPSRAHFTARRDQCDCVAVWFRQADRYRGDFSRLLAAAMVLAGLRLCGV